MTFTSWPLPEESLLTALHGFLPNLRIELALRTSFSVVLRIGMVPSGQESPFAAQSWKISVDSSALAEDSLTMGLSGGS